MFLFPRINGNCRLDHGWFTVPHTLRASIADFDRFCLETFARRLALEPGVGEPWLILCRDPALPPEGYRLSVTAIGIHITAASEEGVIHGLTTVYLALEDGKIPLCQIEDAPKYPYRGQSLDTVRHFFPLEEVERIIEQMSLVKMNVLHFHLTDDQGWRIESHRFPRLHQVNPDYYTQEQLRQLVEFAQVRGIRIIPEIDLPGHTTAILAAYPELGCTGTAPSLAQSGGIYNTILCAGNEEVYTFLEGLLEEICDIFPDPEFHIGGDEAPKSQWCRCPKCRAKLAALGSGDFEDPQAHFTGRVSGILKQLGKRPVCWNETLKGNLVPDELRIQFWTLDRHQKMIDYARRGRPFVFSSMFELYLDYPYSMTGVRKLYRMKPRIWTYDCRKAPGFLGFESTLWTEHIETPQSLEEHLFPRLYIVAEKTWSSVHDSYPRFCEKLDRLCALAHRSGIATMPRSDWNPTGQKRRTEALDFFQKMNGGVLDTDTPANLEPVKPSLPFLITYVTRFFRPGDLPALAKLYFK